MFTKQTLSLSPFLRFPVPCRAFLYLEAVNSNTHSTVDHLCGSAKIFPSPNMDYYPYEL